MPSNLQGQPGKAWKGLRGQRGSEVSVAAALRSGSASEGVGLVPLNTFETFTQDGSGSSDSAHAW